MHLEYACYKQESIDALIKQEGFFENMTQLLQDVNFIQKSSIREGQIQSHDDISNVYLDFAIRLQKIITDILHRIS